MFYKVILFSVLIFSVHATASHLGTIQVIHNEIPYIIRCYQHDTAITIEAQNEGEVFNILHVANPRKALFLIKEIQRFSQGFTLISNLGNHTIDVSLQEDVSHPNKRKKTSE